MTASVCCHIPVPLFLFLSFLLLLLLLISFLLLPFHPTLLLFTHTHLSTLFFSSATSYYISSTNSNEVKGFLFLHTFYFHSLTCTRGVSFSYLPFFLPPSRVSCPLFCFRLLFSLARLYRTLYLLCNLSPSTSTTMATQSPQSLPSFAQTFGAGPSGFNRLPDINNSLPPIQHRASPFDRNRGSPAHSSSTPQPQPPMEPKQSTRKRLHAESAGAEGDESPPSEYVLFRFFASQFFQRFVSLFRRVVIGGLHAQ